MTRGGERAIGTAILAVIAVAGLGAAWLMPWFEYDFSSGRKTAPDGPYNEGQTGAVHHHLTFYADHLKGDIPPSDAATASRFTHWMPIGIVLSAGLLVLAMLGEIPFVDRIIGRRVAIALLTLALLGLAATATAAWTWLPKTMATQGGGSQFAATLDDDSGYSSTNLSWGLYALAAAFVPTIGAVLVKFQAGTVRLQAAAHLMNKTEAEP